MVLRLVHYVGVGHELQALEVEEGEDCTDVLSQGCQFINKRVIRKDSN